MTESDEIQELLRSKAYLRAHEAQRCFGVTKSGLNAIREARPDLAIKFPGLTQWRYKATVIHELLRGSREQGVARAGGAPSPNHAHDQQP